MEWLLQNKEWLFSGIAVALPLTILGWFFSRKGENKQVQKSGDHSTNVQIGGNVSISERKNDKQPKSESRG